LGILLTTVKLTADVRSGIMDYAKDKYPNEMILLLRGRLEKGVAHVESLVIPPFAAGSRTRSLFNQWALPPDPSLIGTVHSHPSGIARPSTADLLYSYGAVIMILGFPADLKAFDRNGKYLDVIIDG